MRKVIQVPVANLYAYSSEQAPVVSQGLYGWTVQVIEEAKEFLKIKTPDEYEGWVRKKDISSPCSTFLAHQESWAQINYSAVHLYAIPDLTRSRPIFTLPFEVRLPIVSEPEDEEHRWVQVRLINGECAWIARHVVNKDPCPLSIEQMINLSQRFIGIPYTWGGVSSFGYDCSGFIQMLLRQIGILLPRDAYQQIDDPQLEGCSLEELSAGDLLFFGAHERKITHVGMCINARQMAHATAREVPILQITDIKDSFLRRRYPYRTARRLKSCLKT